MVEVKPLSTRKMEPMVQHLAKSKIRMCAVSLGVDECMYNYIKITGGDIRGV